MTINDKIKQVLTIKNLSPSHLADDIGIQRSSISHILSGRNRPSLDIIQRIVRRFPEFTYDWFLEEDIQMSTSRSAESVPSVNIEPAVSPLISVNSAMTISNPAAAITTDQPIVPISMASDSDTGKTVNRILLFYTDGTFREYIPATRT